MPRFIPPRKQPKIPAIRPLTVIENVDDYSYSCAYCGTRMEMFTQSGGEFIAKLRPGETVFSRNVDKDKLLFLPAQHILEKHGQELWLSPGGYELWCSRGGAPIHVLTDTDYITHLFWSQIDNNLYMCTYGTGDNITHVYRIDRSAGTKTEIVNCGATADPIVDSAELGSYIYLHYNAYQGGAGDNHSGVRRFDPVGGTWSEVLNYYDDLSYEGYAGGIALQGSTLVASDGNSAARSTDGTTWVNDYTLTDFNSYDNFELILNKDDGYIYGAQNDPDAAADPLIVKRTGDGAWSSDYATDPVWLTGVVSFGQEYDASGTSVALYAQRWGWYTSENPEILRKPASGSWTQDWAGPGNAWMGVYSQGIVQFRGLMHALFYDAASTITRLYRRLSAGVWSLIKEWSGYGMLATHAYSSGMCVAPNATMLCHTV